METILNFTNPTQYSALVPLLDLLLVYNDTKVGHLTARDVTIEPGTNTGVNVNMQWSPLDLGGPSAVLAGQDLISRFVSGKLILTQAATKQPPLTHVPGLNTSVTIKTLGQALSRVGFEVQIPNLSHSGGPDKDPDQPGQDNGHQNFIQDATVLTTFLDTVSHVVHAI